MTIATVSKCDATNTKFGWDAWGTHGIPCQATRGLRPFVDAAGITRFACPSTGHRENAERRFGVSTPMEDVRRDPSARFWAMVDTSAGPDECWPWIGYLAPNGYGRFTVATDQRARKAHRVAYELAVGPIPDGLLVRHSCDNPPCCNPTHLSVGTQVDNMRDARDRGRVADPSLTRHPGESSGTARLTNAQAGEIFDRHAAGGISQAALAREYGVSTAVVWEIVHRRTYLDATAGHMDNVVRRFGQLAVEVAEPCRICGRLAPILDGTYQRFVDPTGGIFLACDDCVEKYEERDDRDDEDGYDLNPEGDPTRNGAFG